MPGGIDRSVTCERAWLGFALFHRVRIHPGARIGEFCVIEPDVSIGAACLLEPYVYVKRWTTLGERNEISAGTVLGTDPLDKNFTRRAQLPAHRKRQQDPRALHHLARHRRRNRSPKSATTTTS